MGRGGDGLVGGRWVRVKGLGPLYQQAGEGGGDGWTSRLLGVDTTLWVRSAHAQTGHPTGKLQ